jgi:putative transposase
VVFVFDMPRKARIDVAGALQHIIVRGIERRKIFWDDADRDPFVNRLGQVLIDVHLLMRTGLRLNT